MMARHGFAALVSAVALAGCVTGSSEPQAPLRQAVLAGGDVVVAGPGGYCVDPVTLSNGAGRRQFAVIASCHILSGGEEGMFVEPLMLTVTVGPRTGAVPLPLPPAIALEAGQSLLDGAESEDLVLAHLSGGGEELLQNGDPRYWRGALRQNGHLVGLALYAPRDSHLAGADGAAFLRLVQREIGERSPEAPLDAPAGNAAQPRAQGLLGRLFGEKDS